MWIVARVRLSSRWMTFALSHHGRNCGYASTASTSANICCAEWPTSTVFSTTTYSPSSRTPRHTLLEYGATAAIHEYRSKQESLPRLFHRGAIRGRRRTRRLGSESDTRRPRADQGSI